jgi:hypothetical protein
VLASVKRASMDIPRGLAALARQSAGGPLSPHPPPPQSVSFMGAGSSLGPAASSVSPFGASPFTGPSFNASPFAASSFTASPFGASSFTASPFGSSPFGGAPPETIPEDDGDDAAQQASRACGGLRRRTTQACGSRSLFSSQRGSVGLKHAG